MVSYIMHRWDSHNHMYRLKCGLEVHAQLLSKHKLFSATKTSFQETPNAFVSYFDAALPGTQPILNKNCLRLALTSAAALNADVKQTFSFDRKHYMYPDQPTGYQITQQFQPFAANGYLDLNPRDYSHPNKHEPTRVRIKQIQIEQDTGKTIYVDNESHVDLNRANTGLIELVTEPDIPSPEAAGVFVKKLQALLRHLKICSGEMESGAMRVDVNVSVNDGPRCEIKNLFSRSAVIAAIKAEFRRQVEEIKAGNTISSETRGWDGKNTWKLRGKEGTIDYRYMPDPEIPVMTLKNGTMEKVQASLPVLPDTIFDDLLTAYEVPLVDAKTLMDHGMAHVDFYKQAHKEFLAAGGTKPQLVANWLVNKWIGQTSALPPVSLFVDLLKSIDNGEITSSSGKLILKHLAALAESDALGNVTVDQIIDEFDLRSAAEPSELAEICQAIVNANPDVVERIRKGKKNSISFLLGQAMKETQGTYPPAEIKRALEKALS